MTVEITLFTDPACPFAFSAEPVRARLRWHAAVDAGLDPDAPVEAYEAAIASLAPELPRRPAPESVIELLQWSVQPLATAEIVA